MYLLVTFHLPLAYLMRYLTFTSHLPHALPIVYYYLVHFTSTLRPHLVYVHLPQGQTAALSRGTVELRGELLLFRCMAAAQHVEDARAGARALRCARQPRGAEPTSARAAPRGGTTSCTPICLGAGGANVYDTY